MPENQKLNYFIDQTNIRLTHIEDKIDTLITFRMMLIGASIAVSTIVSLGITIVLGR